MRLIKLFGCVADRGNSPCSLVATLAERPGQPTGGPCARAARPAFFVQGPLAACVFGFQTVWSFGSSIGALTESCANARIVFVSILERRTTSPCAIWRVGTILCVHGGVCDHPDFQARVQSHRVCGCECAWDRYTGDFARHK